VRACGAGRGAISASKGALERLHLLEDGNLNCGDMLLAFNYENYQRVNFHGCIAHDVV
jgi:hypothetical protein